MKKITLILLLFSVTNIFSQTQNNFGKYYQNYLDNGVLKTRIVTTPMINNGVGLMTYENTMPLNDNPPMPRIRWSFNDPYAVANNVAISGDGLLNIAGWYLNSQRISAYDTNSSTPLWEYTTPSIPGYNYVVVSDTTGIIAAGSYHNFYLFHKNSNVPFFNFDLTTIHDTGTAGPVGLTFNGNFLVACVVRNDSSTVLGFNSSSNVPVWSYRMATAIQGVKIAGYDSLLIVNTYYGWAVLRTYTGTVKGTGQIYGTTGGTQTQQAISGDGNYIATINYYGWVYCLHWNGSTYSQVWSFQEPPGTYYNWMVTVDISTDGLYLAAGTLNFLSSSSFDGKVRYFTIANGSTPVWTKAGFGDEVSQVMFSRNSKILAASTWGDLNNTVDNLQMFKTSANINVPLYTVHTPGSLFNCSISDDGRSVVAGGKLVHARQFGYGGTLYNIYVDTSLNPVNIHNISNSIPGTYELKQNFPNPFNPTTKIEFQTPTSGLVNLKVYDITGKEIAILVNQNLSAGIYEADFSADKYQLSSGVYFYRLTTPNYTKVLKMALIK